MILPTDFNEIFEGDVAVLKEHSSDAWFGQVVKVGDGDGNTCSGRVSRIKNGLVYVTLDWETWDDGHL